MPSATQLRTMSRSVIIPWSRLSSPQMGSAPTPRSFILRAASVTVSLTEAHSAPDVITSRAVVMLLLLSSVRHRMGVFGTHRALLDPEDEALERGPPPVDQGGRRAPSPSLQGDE